MANVKKGDAPKPKAPSGSKVKGTPSPGGDKGGKGGKGKAPPFGKIKGC